MHQLWHIGGLNQLMNHLSPALAPTNQLLIAQIRAWQIQLSNAGMNTSDSPKRLIAALLAALETRLQHLSADDLIVWIEQCRINEITTASTTHRLNSDQSQATLTRIQNQRKLARASNRYPGQSKLDRYQQAIRQLIQQGASQRDIRWWLKREKRCVVSQSTICRYLKAWQITS